MAYLCSSTNQPLLCNFFFSKLQRALLLQTFSVLFRICFVFSFAAARLKTFFCTSLHQVHPPIPTSHCYAKMNAAKHKERLENQNSNDLSNSFTKPWWYKQTIFSPDLQKHHFNQTQRIERGRGGGCCIAIFATWCASRGFIKSLQCYCNNEMDPWEICITNLLFSCLCCISCNYFSIPLKS
jgi:hypothetical protein